MDDFFDISQLGYGEAEQEQTTDPGTQEGSELETDQGTQGEQGAQGEGEGSEDQENQNRHENFDPEEEDNRVANGDFHESLNPFVNFLSDNGIINVKDKDGKDVEIKTFDDLKNVLKQNIEDTKIPNNVNDSQKRYLESLEHGIPLNEFEKVEKSLGALNAITEDMLKTDQQLRFDVLCNDLISQGFDQEKAVKVANTFMKDEESSIKDASDIIERGKISLKESFEKLKNDTKQQYQASYESLTKVASETKDVLGIPFNDTLKDKVVKSMTTRAGQNESGVPLNAFDKWRIENKEQAELILHTLMVYTDNFTKLDKVKATVKSDSVKALEDTLRGKNTNKGKGENFTYNNEDVTLI